MRRARFHFMWPLTRDGPFRRDEHEITHHPLPGLQGAPTDKVIYLHCPSTSRKSAFYRTLQLSLRAGPILSSFATFDEVRRSRMLRYFSNENCDRPATVVGSCPALHHGEDGTRNFCRTDIKYPNILRFNPKNKMKRACASLA